MVDPLLGPCGAYQVPKTLPVLAVTDERERVAAIAGALAAWDVPRRPVRVTIRLILATQDGVPPDAPPEVGEVSRSLARVTRFTHFVRLGAGTSSAEPGTRMEVALGSRHLVRFRVASMDVAHGVVRLAPFEVFERDEGVQGQPAPAPRPLLTLAEVNLPMGREENLVGATGRGGERALFLALSAAPSDAPAPAASRGN